jgi:dihydrofolate reductase
MKVILVMVSSLNGKTTKGQTEGTSSWASPEDQAYFFQTLQDNNLLIMGSKTYEVAKPEMKLTSDRLRVILTSRPEDYKTDIIDGQLEFSSEQPTTLLKHLEERGYHQAVLLGGARTNTEFFKEDLVSELWLTLEPKIFGTGNDLFSELNLNLNLELINLEKINNSGTLLLKYHVIF